LHAMIHFCTNENECRSETIGLYFNDHRLHPCGVCDNCLRIKNVILSNEEFNAISTQIKKISSESPLSSTKLFVQLSSFKKNKIRKVLTFLQQENIIMVNKEGLIKSI
ncbi:MAG TPA: RecQ family zinc-binding domain-containing protein, partial [Hanamia sp.]|nr:RecQ family zinc-binding domain-containing protein [Hanamia sp.]